MKKLSIIFRIVLCALIVSASSLTVFADETVEDEKAKVSSPALQISPVTAGRATVRATYRGLTKTYMLFSMPCRRPNSSPDWLSL